MKTGVEIIAEERQRHFDVEGWTAEHDDRVNDNGQLAQAAACYAITPDTWYGNILSITDLWPWSLIWWKPSHYTGNNGRIRHLAKAGALIAAEIDRLQRLKK